LRAMLGLICVFWFMINIILFSGVIGGFNPATDSGYNVTGDYSDISSSIDEGFSILTIIGSLPAFAGLLFLGIGYPSIPVFAQVIISMIYLVFDVFAILFILSFTE